MLHDVSNAGKDNQPSILSVSTGVVSVYRFASSLLMKITKKAKNVFKNRMIESKDIVKIL